MNSTEAIQYLHERHPHVIDAPGGEVDLEALHLEFFWFQSHVCDGIDDRRERAVRRCFETMHKIFVAGDATVRRAVCGDFVEPELVCHPDLVWAMERMPPLLAEICARVKRHLEETFRRNQS